MASQFETKGWPQHFNRPLGQLQPRQYNNPYVKEKSRVAEEDESIYYPLVYNNEDKLKMILNPSYGLPKTSQVPSSVKKSDYKCAKSKIATFDEGCYEVLQCTGQSSPPLKHQLNNFGSRSDLHAPVSRSTLRALKYDFNSNDRVLTFEPSRGKNNNYVYKQQPGKASFVKPQFTDSLIENENNETLLDYCTCMCCVKGAFYHFTKDSDNEGHIADEPCTCTGPLKQCLPRWCCLSIFALWLPCLCCYLPLKGCQKLQQSCRNANHPSKK